MLLMAQRPFFEASWRADQSVSHKSVPGLSQNPSFLSLVTPGNWINSSKPQAPYSSVSPAFSNAACRL